MYIHMTYRQTHTHIYIYITYIYIYIHTYTQVHIYIYVYILISKFCTSNKTHSPCSIAIRLQSFAQSLQRPQGVLRRGLPRNHPFVDGLIWFTMV